MVSWVSNYLKLCFLISKNLGTSYIFLGFISNLLIPLSENTLFMGAVLSNLLRFILWSNIGPILENAPCTCKSYMYLISLVTVFYICQLLWVDSQYYFTFFSCPCKFWIIFSLIFSISSALPFLGLPCLGFIYLFIYLGCSGFSLLCGAFSQLWFTGFSLQ